MFFLDTTILEFGSSVYDWTRPSQQLIYNLFELAGPCLLWVLDWTLAL